MQYIDLSDDFGPKTKCLIDRNAAVDLRFKYKLNDLDGTKDKVTIIVPPYCYGMGFTFFYAMFGRSVLTLGKDSFRLKYLFDAEPTVVGFIAENIDNSWAFDNPEYAPVVEDTDDL